MQSMIVLTPETNECTNESGVQQSGAIFTRVGMLSARSVACGKTDTHDTQERERGTQFQNDLTCELIHFPGGR